MKTQDLFDVAGLSVLITGGAKGLGRAFAEAMLDNSPLMGLSNPLAPPMDISIVGDQVAGTVTCAYSAGSHALRTTAVPFARNVFSSSNAGPSSAHKSNAIR